MSRKFKTNWTKPETSPLWTNPYASDRNHKHTLYRGQQITPTVVRWECRCGATRDEYDSPVPHA